MLFVAQTITIVDIVAITIATFAFFISIYIVIRDNKNRKYDILLTIINTISGLHVEIAHMSTQKKPNKSQLNIISAELVSSYEILSFLANDHQLKDKHVHRLAEKSLIHYFEKYSKNNLINEEDQPEIFKLVKRWGKYPPTCIQNRILARLNRL